MRARIAVKRPGIVMLCLVMAWTMVPLLEGPAHAAEEEVKDEIVELSPEEVRKNREEAIAAFEKEEGIACADEAEKEAYVKKSQAVSDDKLFRRAETGEAGLKGLKLNGYDDTGMFIYASEPDDEGIVQLDSADLSSSDYRFQDIYIGDDYNDVSDVSDLTLITSLSGSDQLQFSKLLDMKYFSVGYHTIYVSITDGTETKYAVVKGVPTYIYQKVSNSVDNYYTYPTKFNYRYTDSTYYSNSGEYLSMFMDYRKKGAKDWSKTVYRMDDSYTNYVKKGLKANTAYQVRLMLGKTFTYGGETYTFTGRQTGFASSSKTIKTAYKKPAVKSVKISKGKNICHKYKVLYAYRYRYRVNKSTGYRRLISITPLYHRYKYWYTRFKVTVSFKKKQDIAGVHIYTIQGLNVTKKGNKKSYSQTFKCSGKKKGKKVTVKVQNWRSNKYGGYSGKLSKKVRIK